jgi:CRP-like cAMP-binding protein
VSQYQNKLLAKLGKADIALLGPMTHVDLALRDDLHKADAKVKYVYFPETALASVVATVSDSQIEIGLVGSEGMTGLALVLDDDRWPFDCFVQGAGSAIRFDASRFAKAIGASPSLRRVLTRYANAFATQVASTGIANGRALLEQRLARWLLMVGDRLGSSFPMTHEFLAIMLGVRRAGVTLALQVLEGRGLIRATRGNVAIVDREGLCEGAGGYYGLAEREYDRLLGGN